MLHDLGEPNLIMRVNYQPVQSSRRLDTRSARGPRQHGQAADGTNNSKLGALWECTLIVLRLLRVAIRAEIT